MDSLRNRPLGFVFAAGTSEGADRLRERATELGLNATVDVGIRDSALPRAFGANLLGNEKREQEFRELCQAIGQSLLLDPSKVHDSAWAVERALGYGNDSYLIVFPYNTPTQTLTCLWASGLAQGIPWMALFPRRQKT